MSNFGLFSFIFQEILLPYNLRRGKTHPTHIRHTSGTHPTHIRQETGRRSLCRPKRQPSRWRQNPGRDLWWQDMDDHFEPTLMSAVPGILVAFQPPVAANDILLALVLCSHQGWYTVRSHSFIDKPLCQGIQKLILTATMQEAVTDLPVAKAYGIRHYSATPTSQL